MSQSVALSPPRCALVSLPSQPLSSVPGARQMPRKGLRWRGRAREQKQRGKGRGGRPVATCCADTAWRSVSVGQAMPQQRLVRPARSALHWPNRVQRQAASGRNSGPATPRSGEKQPPNPHVCNGSPQSTSAAPTICPFQSALENSFCVGEIKRRQIQKARCFSGRAVERGALRAASRRGWGVASSKSR